MPKITSAMIPPAIMAILKRVFVMIPLLVEELGSDPFAC